MTEPFVLLFDDPIIDQLNFKPYRNAMIRRVEPFVPRDEEAQTMEVNPSFKPVTWHLSNMNLYFRM